MVWSNQGACKMVTTSNWCLVLGFLRLFLFFIFFLTHFVQLEFRWQFRKHITVIGCQNSARKKVVSITSPKGFSASKCDVGNWICSKLGIFEKLSGNFLDFLGFFGIFFWIFRGFFLEEYFLEEFFGEDFFGGFFLAGFFWQEFFVYIVKVS